jgi:protein-export membrane protein SecD
MDEVSYALEERKIIIPILLHSCTIPFRLRRVQYIDFTADYNTGFSQLLRALRIDQPVQPQEPAVPEETVVQDVTIPLQETPQEVPTLEQLPRRAPFGPVPRPQEAAPSPIREKDRPEVHRYTTGGVRETTWLSRRPKRRLLLVGGVLLCGLVTVLYLMRLIPGLGLKERLYLVLEVQVDKAIERMLGQRAEALQQALVAKGLAVVDVKPNGLQGIRMMFSKPPEKSVVDEVVRAQDPVGEVRQQSSGELMYIVSAAEFQHFRTSVVDDSLEKIRKRVATLGVSKPSISREGIQSIVVQLPGLQDTQRAIDLISKTAQLELKLVHSQTTTPGATPPPGTQFLPLKKKDPRTGQLVEAAGYFVERRAQVTGDMLADARAIPDQSSGQYYVLMQLGSLGKRIFERLTRENIGRALAIVLDDVIYSAPVIQEPISGGEARITGNFTPEEARDLAIVLRGGALPAPVTVIDSRVVGSASRQ